VASIFDDFREEGLRMVREGPGYERDETGQFRRTGRGRKIRQKSKEYYSQYVPDALGIPKKDFDIGRGAPIGIRTKLDFFRDKTSQGAVLVNKYGKENVTAINVGGDPKFLFKDKGKWSFVDPVGFEIGDVTADLAGDVIPTTAAIVGGVAALPSGPAGSAASAAAAQFSAGLIQDSIARGMTRGVDFDPVDIVVDRAKEAALTGTLDYATMKTGRFLVKGLLRKEGTDLATQQLKELQPFIKEELPQFIYQGETKLNKFMDFAEKSPDGAIAKFAEDVRDNIGRMVDDSINPRGLSPEENARILSRGVASAVNQAQSEINAVEEGLKALAERKSKIGMSKGAAKAAEKLEREKAKKVFNENLENKAKDLRARTDVSPEQAGKTLQQLMARQRVRREAQSRTLFDEAYAGLEGVGTTPGKLSEIFNKFKGDAILDAEGEVISSIAPQAVTKAGTVVKKFDELDEMAFGGPSISFKQLNEMIQLISAKPGNEFKQLAAALRTERDRLLNQPSVSSSARGKFNEANRFFRDEILPNRSGAIGRATKEGEGANYNEAIKAAQRGEDFTVPRLSATGTKVLKEALSDPKLVDDFLKFSGNTPAARNILREKFLSDLGLVAGEPIPRSALKLRGTQRDIFKKLYEPDVAQQKLKILDDLARFAAQEGDFVEGLTADTFNKLMMQSDKSITAEMARIAKKEIAARAELRKLQSQRLIKLYNSGELPLPSNPVGMESFAPGLLASKPADIKVLMSKIAKDDPETLDSLRNAVYNDILSKADRGKDAAQVGRLGYQLWNPKEMEKILDKQGPKLKLILGDEGVYFLTTMNNGLKRVSVKRPGQEAEQFAQGATASLGGIQLFFSNIGGRVKNKLISNALTAEMALPFPIQKMLTAESYDRVIEGMTKFSFLTTKGLTGLLKQAEADPEFRRWLTETYTDLTESAEQERLRKAQSIDISR
jgi:hypothetical protein